MQNIKTQCSKASPICVLKSLFIDTIHQHGPMYYMKCHGTIICLLPTMGTSLVAQMVKRLPRMQETQVKSPGWEDILEKEMATHSSIMPGKSHGWRSLVGYSPWGGKESDTTEQLHFHFYFPTMMKNPMYRAFYIHKTKILIYVLMYLIVY